jgi:flagellin
MQTVTDMVIRVRELVIQAANDTNVHEAGHGEPHVQSDRARLQDEINQLLDEIDQIAGRTEFNTRILLDGSWSPRVTAAAQDASAEISFVIERMVAGGVEDLNSILSVLGNTFDPDAAVLNLGDFLADRLGFDNVADLTAFINSVGGLSEPSMAGHLNDFAITMGFTGAGAWTALLVDEGFDATTSLATVLALEPAGAPTLRDAMRASIIANAAGWGLTDAATATTALAANADFDQWLAGRLATVDGLTGLFEGGGHNAPLQAAVIGWAGGAPAWAEWRDENLGTLAQVPVTETVTRDATAAELALLLEDPTHEFTDAELGLAAGETLVSQAHTVTEGREETVTGGQPLWFHIGANQGQGINLNLESVSVQRLGLSDLRTYSAGARFEFDPQSQNVAAGRQATYDGIASNADLEYNIGIMRRDGEWIGSSLADGGSGFINMLDEAISVIAQQRSILGAMQNRLEFTIQNLNVASENLSAANSRIRDADMAREMMRFTQTNVLQQAATSMLAQANQAPQSILQLLG